MGWHIGMTEEEMKEFAGMSSCPISHAKEKSNVTPVLKEDQSKTRITASPNKDIEKKSSAITTSTTSTTSTTTTTTTTTTNSNQMSSCTKQGNTNTACPLPISSLPPPPPPNVQFIYHLCQQSKWDEAVQEKLPYFPPTYMKDGKFTRASLDKGDMVNVANQYYQQIPGRWIVLEIDCKMLYSLGIPILAQIMTPPPLHILERPVKCLQIFGGISTSQPLVHKVYPLLRNNPSSGEFLQLLESLSPSTIISSLQPENGKETTSNTKRGVSTEQSRRKKGIFERWWKG
jgi:hypothetical protein